MDGEEGTQTTNFVQAHFPLVLWEGSQKWESPEGDVDPESSPLRSSFPLLVPLTSL